VVVCARRRRGHRQRAAQAHLPHFPVEVVLMGARHRTVSLPSPSPLHTVHPMYRTRHDEINATHELQRRKGEKMWHIRCMFRPCDAQNGSTCGALMVPARALPVPFCFQGLRPPPATSLRVFALCVPCASNAAPIILHYRLCYAPPIVALGSGRGRWRRAPHGATASPSLRRLPLQGLQT